MKRIVLLCLLFCLIPVGAYAGNGSYTGSVNIPANGNLTLLAAAEVHGGYVNNNTGGNITFNAQATSVVRDVSGYNNGEYLGTPTVPASGTAYTNPYGVDAWFYVSGGTVTSIAVNGQVTGLTSGPFRVQAGGTIVWNGSVAPQYIVMEGS